MPSSITTAFFGTEVQLFPIEGSDNLYRAMWLDEEAAEIKYLGKWTFKAPATKQQQPTVRPAATVTADSTTDEDSPLPSPTTKRVAHPRTKISTRPLKRQRRVKTLRMRTDNQ